jgi:hypothetical protein
VARLIAACPQHFVVGSGRGTLHFVMAVRLPGRLVTGTLRVGMRASSLPNTSQLREMAIVTGSTTDPFGIDTTVPGRRGCFFTGLELVAPGLEQVPY